MQMIILLLEQNICNSQADATSSTHLPSADRRACDRIRFLDVRVGGEAPNFVKELVIELLISSTPLLVRLSKEIDSPWLPVINS